MGPINLFIIGNGFDLSHNLKTSYENFKDYLKNKYQGVNYDKFVMPEVYMGGDGEEIFNDIDAVSFLIRTISITEGNQWNDIETTLGNLDFSECFDWLDYALDSEGDIDILKQAYLNEDIASNLILPTINISKYFSDWIDTITIDDKVSIKKDFLNLINPYEDLFLTFNYTETLEKVYKVKNICHIHGKQGNEILFGHGNDTGYYENNMSSYIGVEDAWCQIHWNLRKDTVNALKKHMYFFNEIDSKVEKVYSYGFSFSEVDAIYIREICSRLTNSNIIWYLNNYDKSKHGEYKKILRRCGYKKRFGTYG